MEASTEKLENGWVVVTISGRVDAHTSPELDTYCHARLDEGVTSLALDISGVQYMSSAGLRVLLSVLKEMGKRNGKLVLLKPQDNVREILEISGFSKIFTISDKL
ncbi:MAG: STAS domain-containing protein [Acidobacteria bacterium]|nr:STAS domain-containing protein [Acidobacteriota bacterium]